MDHKFVPSQLDAGKCNKCKRSAIDHTSLAECETCSNKGTCNIVRDMLLCADCEKNEIDMTTVSREQNKDDFMNELDKGEHVEEKLPEVNETVEGELEITDEAKRQLTPAQYLDKLSASIMAELPANGSQFYNAKVTAIANLEKQIMADENIPKEKKWYFFAQQITIRQLALFKNIISAREIITEIETERYANFKAINQLAQRLSKEEREKLNIKYAEYVPQVLPKKVRNPRMSGEDKLIEGIAKLMFAPKKDGIVQWEALEAKDRQNCIEKAKQYYKMISGKK